jgi:hypothetical protein
MLPAGLADFPAIWSHDFEFSTVDPTGRPTPHTYVATRLGDGHRVVLAGDALRRATGPPFDVRRDLALAYNFQAESQCFEVLGWPQPWWALDPMGEYLAATNGEVRDGAREVDAMRHYGLEVSAGEEAHKAEMQRLGARGEPYSAAQWRALRDYCAADTDRLIRLFEAMRPTIDLHAALVRGRYLISTGQQTHRGLPVAADELARYEAHRPALKRQFIDEHPECIPFYPGGHFSNGAFLGWCDERRIGWPRHKNGLPVTDKDTLRLLARLEPRAAPFAALRPKLAAIKASHFPVRSDGRIRPDYWPLRTHTGRNAPKAKQFPMLQKRWLRGFVLAPPGRMLAQLDFRAQEVYIAAALSGDRNLLEDLEGDVYLGFAIRAGLAPKGATKGTHRGLRDRMKTAVLGLIYGMHEQTLALRLDVDVISARRIRQGFSRHYATLWDWSESVVAAAQLTGRLETPLGWPYRLGPEVDLNELRNHPVQACGGDVLRASCLLAQDAGLSPIATLHDSILLEADAGQIEQHATLLARAMTRGAECVIGVPIPAEVEFIARRYRLDGPDLHFFADVTRRLASLEPAGERGLGVGPATRGGVGG